MRYIKLFEEINSIEEKDFPYDGHELSVREAKILTDLIGYEKIRLFYIKVDDHFYYVNYNNSIHHVVFDDFNELKDYILSNLYIRGRRNEEYLELLKTSKLDPSFHKNWPIRWASMCGYTDIVKLLLHDPRVDPSAEGNFAIKSVSNALQNKLPGWSEYVEIVKLLLNDPRVIEKLTEKEISEYINEIS